MGRRQGLVILLAALGCSPGPELGTATDDSVAKGDVETGPGRACVERLPPQCFFGDDTRSMERASWLALRHVGNPETADDLTPSQADMVRALYARWGQGETPLADAMAQADRVHFEEIVEEDGDRTFDLLRMSLGSERGGIFYGDQIVATISDQDIWDCLVFRPSRANACIPVQNIVARELEGHDLFRLRSPLHKQLDFPEDEVIAQSGLPNNQVGFGDALDLAIRSFFHDGSDEESPRALLEFAEGRDPICTDYHRIDRTGDAERVRCFMDHPLTRLAIVGRSGTRTATAGYRVFRPEEGESIDDYWAFFLQMPQLTGHLHWALVRRTLGDDGQPIVKNYGFN